MENPSPQGEPVPENAEQKPAQNSAAARSASGAGATEPAAPESAATDPAASAGQHDSAVESAAAASPEGDATAEPDSNASEDESATREESAAEPPTAPDSASSEATSATGPDAIASHHESAPGEATTAGPANAEAAAASLDSGASQHGSAAEPTSSEASTTAQESSHGTAESANAASPEGAATTEPESAAATTAASPQEAATANLDSGASQHESTTAAEPTSSEASTTAQESSHGTAESANAASPEGAATADPGSSHESAPGQASPESAAETGPAATTAATAASPAADSDSSASQHGSAPDQAATASSDPAAGHQPVAILPGSSASATPDDPDSTPPQGIPVQIPGQGQPQYQAPRWNDPVTAPFKRIRSNDPLAAAIGNASLLGVGYFLMRRGVIAMLSIFLTAVMVVLLATAWRTTWFEIVFLVWWVALIAHGWFLAGRKANKVKSRNQRIAAVAFAVPVILVVGLLRWNAGSIESDIDDARAAGDCPAAQGAIDDIWFGHNIVDAPMTVRSEQTTDACTRLTTAKRQLDEGLATGEPANFDKGFITLRGVLATAPPGHERMVDTVLDGFIKGLPTPEACRTADITDWLRAQKPMGDRLDRVKAVLPKVEPAALLACGDQMLTAKSWESARSRYEELIERYPGDPGVAHAKDGDAEAGLGIEHDHVQDLVTNGTYCSSPAKYSAAPAYKKGTNRGYYLGSDEYVDDLPGGWKTTDFTKAALMVCLGDHQSGPVVRTCPYTYTDGIGTISVAFHKIAIPVKAYSLRTGKRVVDTKIQISGSSCPASFTYSSYGGGPPGDQDITPTKSGVQLAFKFLVVR